MSCCGDQTSICPCGAFVHPAVISNVAGLDAISYRVGDYTTFREALLRALPGEVSLTYTPPQSASPSPGSTAGSNVVQLWRPGATGDLAVQMIEWWAYLADILTFYNERTATQAYIRTADQSITVNRLVRLLGYRPKPGIGANGTLGALMNGTATFTLPQGFQIQSKPGPGQQPQIFELTSGTPISYPDTLAVDPPVLDGINITQSTLGGVSATILGVVLEGVVSGIKINDELLLVEAPWTAATIANYAIGTVTAVTPGKDPRGNAYTQVSMALTQSETGSAFLNNATTAEASGYQLMKSALSTRLYQYVTASNTLVESQQVDLQSITRQINVGDLVLFEDPASPASAQLVIVTSTTEVICYANNPSSPSRPQTATASNPYPVQIPVLHTQLGFIPPLISSLQSALTPATAVVQYNWQQVGQLIDQAALSVAVGQPAPAGADEWAAGQNAGPLTLDVTPEAPALFPTESLPAAVMLEDANGNGVTCQAAPAAASATGATLTATPPNVPPVTLMAPLDVLFNLLTVTRGKTVTNEVLGSGNAAVANQDFVLQNMPVTYLPDSPGLSGAGYSSTVQLWVNNVLWTEVQNFFGQLPDAHVFITKEDEQGRTHAIPGDGINGARLPTGVNNIVATYRYGSGAAAPAAGALTMILKPLPGLQALRNPVQVGGGGDPDPPDRVRQYAPQSVLTFGRAVSLDDFEAIAGAASGVTLAQAVLGLNPVSQRPQVQVFVLPGTTGAVNSAQQALATAADPNRIPAVRAATLISVSITATLLLASNANPAAVLANATSALAGQGSGLFVFDPNSTAPGVYVLGIGQPVYDSQIYAALQVPGVEGVENYSFSFFNTSSQSFQICSRQRHDPQSGNYFALGLSDLNLTTSPPVPPS